MPSRSKPPFPDTEAPTKRSAATMRLYTAFLAAFDGMTDDQRKEVLDLIHVYLDLPRYAQRRLVSSVNEPKVRAALERKGRA